MLLPSELAIAARTAIRPIFARPTIAVRAIHASPSVLKKKTAIPEEGADAFDDTEEDLFDIPDTLTPSTSSSSSSSSSSIRTAKRASKPPPNPKYQLERAALISQIRSAIDLPPQQRKTAVRPLKTRNIRAIIARYYRETEGDDVGELKGVLRSWRFLGLELTRRAAGEVLAKCMNAGRVDLAVELLNDPVQYGLVEVDTAGLLRLHYRIISDAADAEVKAHSARKATRTASESKSGESSISSTTETEVSTSSTETEVHTSTEIPTAAKCLYPKLPKQSITPSIALANLVLASKVNPTADPQALVQAMDITQSWLGGETTATWADRRARWIIELDAIGKAWGDAGRDIDSRMGPLMEEHKVVKTEEQKAAENDKRRADRRIAKQMAKVQPGARLSVAA